ncbi:hypothetical protein [Zoogloea sp.]|uniref:WD40/YVTN/BNR-like repeat-containing protein n=1 Tax=Zoogloea sp. TaxID=49181 RepID=UPI00261524D2|nr:hypothetical protein [Zoogloea sp.]MDD3353659.1 hypothetical protein [Zoogloea sp.]
MILNRRRQFLVATLSAAVLSACGGGSGSSAPAPADFRIAGGENQIFTDWTAASGVDYWLFFKKGSTVSIGGKDNLFRIDITTPYVLRELDLDTQYAMTLNGRKDGGEGGPGVPAQTTTTRLAGSDWLAGDSTSLTSLAASAPLYGVAYGQITNSSNTYGYVAVGANGNILRTADTDAARGYGHIDATTGLVKPIVWQKPATSTVPASVTLRGVTYASNLEMFCAVGSNGTIVTSTNIDTWTLLPGSPTTASLNGIATSGSAFVAVGDNGTLLYSTNGTSWSPPSSVSASIAGVTLRGVTYSAAGIWVAVGSGGTVLTSTNGTTWTATTLSGDLTAVSAIGLVDGNNNTVYTYVAVGADGTVLTSNNASTWSTTTLAGEFHSVQASTRLVAVGANGVVFTRDTLAGTPWIQRNAPLGNATMYGITRGLATYGQNIYTAVGVHGGNGASIFSY